MKKLALILAILWSSTITVPVASASSVTPHISTTYTQDSVWIGVVFSDANYGGSRLNLYLSPATATCQDFNRSPSWFWFDAGSWWALNASSYGSTGKAHCNRSRAWSSQYTNQYQDGNPASIPNFTVANDKLLGLQIGRIG